ncbi:S8 family serine peptidase [Aureisphaera galaxeae]|uniref:S8 family serine peptidase n=1 Tax=Aureisphaera galaxeae TaxID=1538023 RepID=UPI002350C294|nr:S8 family serine peptidase [Aureisphaera galaxeae]MDC8005039.1 S8 family serine peptidase [Aureisphaera galaxeae]
MKKTTFFSSGKNVLTGFLLTLFFGFSYAQDAYTIQYQDEILDIQENIQSFQWDQMPESSELGNGYFGWVQFYETPTQDIQDAFKANQLRLIDYIPHHTYLFYFPENTSIDYLRNSGVRAIVPVEGRFKLSQDLKNGDIGNWAQQGDKILVNLVHHQNVNSDWIINDLATKQIALVQEYSGFHTLELSIPDNCLDELSNLPYVKWVELIPPPAVKEDTRGRGLHRANGLDTQGAGRNYTGEGVGVLVRDDGIVGPHIDFQGRLDNSFASGTGQTHGDGVAGILAGAGNRNPTMRGMAAGADVFVSNYGSNFMDAATQTLIGNGSVQITNSSYGDGCNAGYTSNARNVDQQIYDNENLLHVFSCGNSNGNNCGYGAGSQWGNITGGHKQGKNCIATANVFFNGILASSSSRGPAHDGRIKPDITANGQNQNSTNENHGYLTFGGTSGAAPGIAGVSAQLYQAYAEANAGDHPPSGLIKATLLNTANDYGNVGPDFRFGWGIVNGLRAGILIEEGRHLTDEVSQGNSNTHTINVPSGTTQVRFMLYWTDPEATPGANPALVNDLDLVVTDPSNGDHLPFVLDSTPDPTSLNLPATNGVDRLNNMEQVLLNNPAAGDYDLEITGFNVPMGPQEYFIVYEIITENLTVTYPNGGEPFDPSVNENIHWDAINTTDGFTIEYTTNDGSSWNSIVTVSAATTNYLWNVPSEITGEARIRITSGSFSDESDGNFSIAPTVTGMNITQVCPTEASFTWTAVAEADGYDLYLLGDRYMEVVGSTNTNSINVPIADPSDEMWYAVAAKNDAQGWYGQRNVATFYAGGLFNCSLANDLSMNVINSTPNDFSTLCGTGDGIVSVVIQNTGTTSQSNFPVSYEVTGQAPVMETFTGTLANGEQTTYDFTTPVNITSNGDYELTVSVDLPGDENEFNDELSMAFNAYVASTTNFTEDFETNGVPPPGWVVSNPDEDITWEEATGITGSDGASTETVFLDNFNYSNVSAEDQLWTDAYDFSSVVSGVFQFDLAKAQRSAGASDVMYVGVSTDCGETFTLIYGKGGLDLSTIPNYDNSGQWEPTASTDWRTEQISIDAYAGQSAVIFRFIVDNNNGNSTFIDNVNVDALLGTEDFTLSELVISPNPATNAFSISIQGGVDAQAKVNLVNSLGQQIRAFDASIFNGNEATINVSDLSAGLYFVQIQNGNQTSTKKLLIR